MAHFVQVTPSDDPYVRSLTQWTDANKRVMLNTFDYISRLKAEYVEKLCKGAGEKEFMLPRSLANPFENLVVKRKVMQLENMVASRDMELRQLRERCQRDAEDNRRLIFQLSRSLERWESEKMEEPKRAPDPDISGSQGIDKGSTSAGDVLGSEGQLRLQRQIVRPQTEITEVEEDE